MEHEEGGQASLSLQLEQGDLCHTNNSGVIIIPSPKSNLL